MDRKLWTVKTTHVLKGHVTYMSANESCISVVNLREGTFRESLSGPHAHNTMEASNMRLLQLHCHSLFIVKIVHAGEEPHLSRGSAVNC